MDELGRTAWRNELGATRYLEPAAPRTKAATPRHTVHHKAAVAGATRVYQDGAIVARVYLVDAPPDGEGDVIRSGAIADGQRVVISLAAHDVLRERAEPAGAGYLSPIGNEVRLFGKPADSPRGKALLEALRERGDGQQWSIGYRVTKSHAPTGDELDRWPDARRIITSWEVVEASPVELGSCGPACRTLSTKCAGNCGCGTRALDAIVDAHHRRAADAAATREPLGALALDVAEKAVRWLTGGREQARPLVKFYDPDNERAGYYTLRDPHAVQVARGLGLHQLVEVVAHEVSHYLRPWDPTELVAEAEGQLVARRYLESLRGTHEQQR